MTRTILTILATLFTLATINHALTQSERLECEQWKVDSIEYASNWFATPWQVEQCKQFDISL